MDKVIKVLVVDDSPTARQIITTILESDPSIKVIGIARNGKDAVEKVQELRPDVITMDFHMPIMNGLEATQQIMAYNPTPIVVVTVSAVKRDQVLVFKQLDAGALDVIEKPSPELWSDLPKIGDELINKVKLVSKITVIRHVVARKTQLPAQKKIPTAEISPFSIVGIATSTGGPKALLHILGELPAAFSLPVVIVQHITEGFVKGLVEWLDSETALCVKEAQYGEKLRKGTVYIAPNGTHTVVETGSLKLIDMPPVGGHRPSANVLLSSLADTYGPKSIGIILSGMGADGAQGIADIKKAGGATIAQDESTCVVFGMPREAIELGAVDDVLPLGRISRKVLQLVRT